MSRDNQKEPRSRIFRALPARDDDLGEIRWGRVNARQAAKCSDAQLRQMMAEAVACVVCDNEILKIMKHSYRAYLVPRAMVLMFRLAQASEGRREDARKTVIDPMVRRMTG